MADGVFDRLVLAADDVLRTLGGVKQAQRPNPARGVSDGALDDAEKRHAAGLMRVNHAGEVCAQALYRGQALTARNAGTRQLLEHAAAEEEDHLAWLDERLKELGSGPSVLNPLWYGASFALGALTGLAGDRVSLGFVEATEDRVARHLESHQARLPDADQRSRAIVAQMHADETRHGETALDAGGDPFPAPVRSVMAAVAKVMTETSYRV